MDQWLSGYERDPEPGAGLPRAAGATKVVIHTTESDPGSWRTIRNLWRGREAWGRGLPHFLAEGDRYVQLLPLDVAAYTLENLPGGVETNRCGPAIQVEIVGRARNGLTDVDYEALGRWLADLVKAGVPLNLSQHPRFYGPDAGFTLAQVHARQRMGHDEFHSFAGFCGHQHVPENSHWDPGALDGARVERIARGHLAQVTAPALAGMEDDDVYDIITDGRSDSPLYMNTFILCGLRKVWVSSQAFAELFKEAAKHNPRFVDHGWQGAGSEWIGMLDHAELVGRVPGQS